MADRVGQQLGNYRLLRLLGRGSIAEVYLGEHLHLNTQAAIKVLHAHFTSEDSERLRTEARVLARLVHPHIVRTLDFDVEDGIPFLIMEYAPNGTLRERHPKGTRVPLDAIVSYVRQVAEALHYIHQQKLIHRDIKPESMLLGHNNEVLLTEFNSAIIIQSTRSQPTLEAAGTVAYMAPEQLRGNPRPASDQYALGIVVYEWLSGEPPFSGSIREIANQHLSVPPPPLHTRIPTISSAIEHVVLKALAKDPQQRFAHAPAFATALEEASHAESPGRTLFAPSSEHAAASGQSKSSPRSLPAGTVTLLYTNIEGSTPLLQQLGDHYATVLAECRRLLHATFQEWNGHEVNTQDDAFFVAFARATDAVLAVVEAQRALAAHPWPEAVAVRVRMGLHTGEPSLTPEGYVGLDVQRAARIMSAAHGGQVLREAMGVPISPIERASYEHAVTAARAQLGEKVFAAAWAEGRTMTPEQALAAQGSVTIPTPASAEPSSTPPAKPVVTYPGGLTAREVEVLRLLAQGLTDTQIADQLVISPRTVNNHLTSIYSKIQVSTRSAATRYAIDHKLT